MVALHGIFPHSATPAPQIEALIAAHVPKRHIKDVSDVFERRWWDYRFMAPGHSFMLFAHCYYKALKTHARRFLAMKRGDASRKGLVGAGELYWTAQDIWDRDAKHITGMWNAMLTADALGIPYDHYCRLACQIAFETKWKRLPRPSQLYSDNMAAMVLYEWQKLTADRFIPSKHPAYGVDAYEGAPVQDAYREWLIEHLGEHKASIHALAAVVYRTPQLPEDIASAHFPAHSLKRASRFSA